MKYAGHTAVVLLSGLLLANPSAVAQSKTIQERVDNLVKMHYTEGIRYPDARALGAEAIPYLVDLLNDPEAREFWVEIIVTLGFLEDSSALPPLTTFFESARGEVDVQTFRALLSVPYAIGCIASNGDPDAYNFLLAHARGGSARPAQWTFGTQDVGQLMTQRGILALAVSGLPAARAELLRLKAEIGKTQAAGAPIQAGSLLDTVDSGLGLMERMSAEGKAAVFSPAR